MGHCHPAKVLAKSIFVLNVVILLVQTQSIANCLVVNKYNSGLTRRSITCGVDFVNLGTLRSSLQANSVSNLFSISNRRDMSGAKATTGAFNPGGMTIPFHLKVPVGLPVEAPGCLAGTAPVEGMTGMQHITHTTPVTTTSNAVIQMDETTTPAQTKMTGFKTGNATIDALTEEYTPGQGCCTLFQRVFLLTTFPAVASRVST